MHMGMDFLEVDLDVTAGDAEMRCLGNGMDMFAGGNHRLGGNTAVIEAVTAHLALFNQHDINTKGGGSGSDAEATGPGTNNTNIRTKRFGHGVS